MGLVIEFPSELPAPRLRGRARPVREPATVIILPVIRIERYADEIAAVASRTAQSPRRGRRRGRTSRTM